MDAVEQRKASGDGALRRGCAAGEPWAKGLLSRPPVRGQEGGRGG